MERLIERPNRVMLKLFYLTVTFLIIGFNIKVFRIEIQYWIFLIFFTYTFLLTGLQKHYSRLKVPLIFILPFIFVFLSFLAKLILHDDIESGDYLQALKYLTMFFYSYSVVLLTANLSLKVVEKISENILRIVSISVIYMSIIGLIQYFDPSLIKGFFDFFYGKDLRVDSDLSTFEYAVLTNRVSSIFPNAMILGGAIAFFTLSIIFFKFRKYSLIDVFAIGSGTLLLLLSNTRAAIIGFIIGLIFWIFKYNRRFFIPGLFLVLFVYGFYYEFLSTRESYQEKNSLRISEVFDYIGSGFDSDYLPASLSSRSRQIDNGLAIFMKSSYVLSGVTKDFYMKYFYSERISLHNQFFSWIVFYGVFGVFFCFWFISLIVIFYRKYKSSNDIEIQLLFSSMYYLMITAFIISLTQPALLTIRWREFMFIYFTLAYVIKYKKQGHYKK